jgi:hypothetical protein
LSRSPDCLKNQREIAGRGIYDLQHFGNRVFLRLGFAKLGSALVEYSLQLGVGPPKISYFVIERRGHLRLPSALLPTGSYLIGTFL